VVPTTRVQAIKRFGLLIAIEYPAGRIYSKIASD